jgi:hypothetical protein
MKKIGRTIFLLLLFSCSNDYFKSSLLDPIIPTKYYNNEIFTSGYLKLYGRWQFSYIYDDAGIVAGPGKINPNYDYLEIKRYGIYGKIKNNVLIESGKIIVVKQVSDQLTIKLESDNEGDYWDITFNAKDSLRMMDASIGCGYLFNQFKKDE